MSPRLRRPRPSHFATALLAAPFKALALGLVVALGLLLPAAPAVAAQGGQLPQNIIASQDPAAFRSEIQGFVEGQVQRLLSEEPQAVGEARDLLVSPVAKPDASDAFRAYYADLLAQRLEAALGTNPKPLNKLNIAIVTEKSARYTRSVRFLPLAARLVADADAAVALWGVKAGYPILPEALSGVQRSGFVPAVAAAVKKFPDNGPLAAEAYATLSLRITDRTSKPSANTIRLAVPTVVPAMHEILALRVGLFRPDRPAPDPQSESPALVFLPHPEVWPVQPAAQQLQTMALLRDLMLAQARLSGNLQGQARRDMLNQIRAVGGAFVAAFASPNLPPNTPGATALMGAAEAVYRISPATPQAAVESSTAALASALATSFPTIPAPAGGGSASSGGSGTTRPTTGER